MIPVQKINEVYDRMLRSDVSFSIDMKTLGQPDAPSWRRAALVQRLGLWIMYRGWLPA